MGMSTKKIIIATLALALMSQPVFAESLFRAGVAENSYAVNPRSLYSAVSARSIGDLITILIEEEVITSDELSFSSSKATTTTDNFSNMLNKILPGKPVNDQFNEFGGANVIGNNAKTSRKTSLENTITAQVVQILPNGNFVVQGKKTAINSGETVNIIVSGIVDPRFVNKLGQVSSSKVANFQVAVTGKGSVSRSGQDGPINRLIRNMF